MPPARLAEGGVHSSSLERGWNCSCRHGGAQSPPEAAAPSFPFPSRPGCGRGCRSRCRCSRWHGQQESPAGQCRVGSHPRGLPLRSPAMRHGAPVPLLARTAWLGRGSAPTLPDHEQNCGDPAAAFWVVSQLGHHFLLE